MIDSFVALDIETTGLNPVTDCIIEIGAIKVMDGIITERFSELIDPGIRLTEKIIELTGITDEMLEHGKDLETVLNDFYKFSKDCTILGHNVLFDYSFIKVGLGRMGIDYTPMGLDTLKISRLVHGDLASKSLESMCKFYGICNQHAHRAFDDAQAAYELYCRLKGSIGEKDTSLFSPQSMVYKVKKSEPITMKQKNYLNDLIKYHKIEFTKSIGELTKSEASKAIDKIILAHGKMHR